MKIRVTRRQIADMGRVVNFPQPHAADIAELCGKRGADMYNAGYLGWNWNAYVMNSFVLVEGCRNFPKDKEVSAAESRKLVRELQRLKTTAGRLGKLERFLKTIVNGGVGCRSKALQR